MQTWGRRQSLHCRLDNKEYEDKKDNVTVESGSIRRGIRSEHKAGPEMAGFSFHRLIFLAHSWQSNNEGRNNFNDATGDYK